MSTPIDEWLSICVLVDESLQGPVTYHDLERFIPAGSVPLAGRYIRYSRLVVDTDGVGAQARDDHVLEGRRASSPHLQNWNPNVLLVGIVKAGIIIFGWSRIIQSLGTVKDVTDVETVDVGPFVLKDVAEVDPIADFINVGLLGVEEDNAREFHGVCGT